MNFGSILLSVIVAIFCILALLTIAAIIFEGFMMLVELGIYGVICVWNKFHK